MKISLIAAIDNNYGIGYKGEIPWYIPSDLARFKTITMGHHILVGRITWDSIKNPLKGRRVIVVTSSPGSYNPEYSPELITDGVEKAIVYARTNGEEELIVAGGSSIYKATIGIADTIYLTRVMEFLVCDRFFPEIKLNEWKIIEKESGTYKKTNFLFQKLVRINPE